MMDILRLKYIPKIEMHYHTHTHSSEFTLREKIIPNKLHADNKQIHFNKPTSAAAIHRTENTHTHTHTENTFFSPFMRKGILGLAAN